MKQQDENEGVATIKNVVTIQKTAKKLKAQSALSWLAIIIGLMLVFGIVILI